MYAGYLGHSDIWDRIVFDTRLEAWDFQSLMRCIFSSTGSASTFHHES
jgi:hypothetical protein